MKYIAILIATLVFQPLLAADLPKDRQIVVQHKILAEGYSSKTVTDGYLIYYPEDYATETDKNFPVVLSLHGNGENGTDIGLLKDKSSFLAGLVELNYNYPFIIVSPLATSSMDALSGGTYLEQLMQHVRDNNRIDISREYIEGISQGGKGARLYAERNAETIAGLVSSAGYGGGDNLAGLVASEVPIILSHNEDDGTVSFGNSERYYNNLIAAGAQHIIFDIKADTGGSHDSWGRVNRNMDYWNWLLSFPNVLSGIEISEQIFTPTSLQVDSSQLEFTLQAVDTFGDVKGVASVQVDFSSIGGTVLNMSSSDNLHFSANYTINNTLDPGIYTIGIVALDVDGNPKTTSTQIEVEEPYNELPVITLTNPLAGNYFAEGDVVTMQADAFDYDGQVSKVEFYANGVLVGSDDLFPYELGINTLKPGEHTISAKVTDNRGAQVNTSDITITITPLDSPNLQTQTVLSIQGADKATGSSHFPMDDAFDSQPSYIDSNGVPELVDGGSHAPAYSGRLGYIDFGEDWDKVRIAQTWTLYRASSAGDHTPYVEVWWDNDKDTVNDSQDFEANINFNGAKNLAYSKEPTWVMSRDMSVSPLTPLNRYLIFRSPDTMSNRASEYAFIGWLQEDLPPLSISLSDSLSEGAFNVNQSIELGIDTINGENITHVEYFANDELIITSTTAPFVEAISFSQAGDYQIVAVAHESSGETTESATVTITIIEQVLDVITIADAGAAEGSKYFPTQFAFDSQPTLTDTGFSEVSGGTKAPYYDGRFGYIDFGENWQNISISKVYTLYRASSGGAQTPYAELWWDDDKDTINDGITETQINFNTATNLSSEKFIQWAQDRDFSEPVTAKGRYLMLHAPDAMRDRALEYVLIGFQ